jgi:hypothetical protein
MRVFWDIAPRSLSASIIRAMKFIALMMNVVRTSETSVYSSETARRYIPDDSYLRIRRRKNLKSHMVE